MKPVGQLKKLCDDTKCILPPANWWMHKAGKTPTTPGNSNSEAWEVAKKELLRKELEKFKQSNALQMDFPDSMDSRDRKLVHDLAEELGLNHVSVGEEPKRFVRVSKK